MLDGVKYRLQPVANGLGRDVRLQLDKCADPTPVVMDNAGVHHDGKEDVGDRAGLGSREGLRGDADDLEKIGPQVERAADYFRVPAKAARPIIVGENGVGM